MIEKDAILAKISNIQNCLKMIRRVTNFDPSTLEDQIVQDVFVLNLQRATQACIDIANLVIAEKGLKLPASYKESFSILEKAKIIDSPTCKKMEKMAGFRNIAVHDYEALSLPILQSILKEHLKDFEEFYAHILDKI